MSLEKEVIKVQILYDYIFYSKQDRESLEDFEQGRDIIWNILKRFLWPLCWK